MSIFKNRTVIGVICILLALVICFGITPLFNQSISQKAEIVRVTKDIHAGELITKDMVKAAIQTDLPELVVPAISRWGIPAKSDTIG